MTKIIKTIFSALLLIFFCNLVYQKKKFSICKIWMPIALWSYPYNNTIQIDDILNITVGALMPEAALPYNKISPTMTMANSLDLIKLEGYLVSQDKTINFPVLGIVSVAGKTTIDFRKRLKERLKLGDI